MICPVCKNEMLLDDIDYNFKGNYDKYYYCRINHCCSCVDKFRFGKHFVTEWCFDRD